MTKPLPRNFYARDTIEVARELIGAHLVRQLDDGQTLVGRVVETEAYLGPEDPAAHSFGGRRTARTETMFGPPGFAYVYFVYGMHHCLNVVTMTEGVPEAVLIRALEPVSGFADLAANGPGKLCRAMSITRAENALDLTTGGRLFFAAGGVDPNAITLEGPRVGIGYAADAIHWPLRFGLAGSPALSKPPFPP